MKNLSPIEINRYGVLIYNGLVYQKEIHGLLCFKKSITLNNLKDVFFLIK